MATREELMQALRNADAAGAEDDARRLAGMIKAMDTPAPAEPAANVPTADPEQAKALSILSMLSGQVTPPADMGVPEAQQQQRAEMVKSQYDNAPTSARLPVMALDAMSNATGLMGLRDIVGSGVKSLATGDPYDEILAKARQDSIDAKTRAGPIAAAIGQVGGDVATLGPLARLMPSSVLPAAAPTGLKTAALVGGGALEGAGLTQLAASLQGEEDPDLQSAALFGGAAGPIGAIAGKTLSKGAGLVDDFKRAWHGDAPRNPPRMTGKELQRAADEVPEGFSVKNTEYAPAAKRDLSKRVQQVADNKTMRITKRGTPTSFKFIDDLQKQLADADIPYTPAMADREGKLISERVKEGTVAEQLKDQMEQFMASGQPTSRGNSEDAYRELKKGRDLSRRAKNVSELETRIAKSDIRRDTQRTGDTEAAIRTKMGDEALDDVRYNEAEQAALKKASKGEKVYSVAGNTGHRLKSHLGLSLASTLGGTIGGAVGGIPGSVIGGIGGAAVSQLGGAALKGVSQRATDRAIEKVLDVMAGKPAEKFTEAQKKIINSIPKLKLMLQTFNAEQNAGR